MHKEIIRKLPISKKIFLFYRTTTLFGLFFTLFGLFFCSIFLQGLDIKEIIKLNEELGEIQGTITNIFETKMTVNDSRIFEYQYEYNIKGESYLWQSFNGANSLEIGNSVTIEYNLTLLLPCVTLLFHCVALLAIACLFTVSGLGCDPRVGYA